MNLSECTIDHLKKVQRLASALNGNGIAILRHDYYALVFGSFTIVMGKLKRRLRFDWDGKEFFLNVSVADCSPLGIIDKWNQKENVRFSSQGNVNPFEKIEELTLKEFSSGNEMESSAAARAIPHF